MIDVGTFGGPNSVVYAIADSGVVAGTAGTAIPNTPHAFSWKNGVMTDLGTVAGDTASFSEDVNSAETVVGESCDTGNCGAARAFVYENGGPMMDLNALVATATDLYLIYAYAIADNGEILAQGVLPNGDMRIAVLTPHGDCDNICEQRISQSASSAHTFASGSPRVPLPINQRFGGYLDSPRNAFGIEGGIVSKQFR
jgi:probable HAF family extracellular repeat protein